jgi:hypothetical protein
VTDSRLLTLCLLFLVSLHPVLVFTGDWLCPMGFLTRTFGATDSGDWLCLCPAQVHRCYFPNNRRCNIFWAKQHSFVDFVNNDDDDWWSPATLWSTYLKRRLTYHFSFPIVVWINTVGMYGFLVFWLGTKEQAEFCQDTRRFDKGRGFNNV